MRRREIGAVLGSVVVMAGSAMGQTVIYSNLTPDPDGFRVQSFVDSPVADDLQVVGGGVLQDITFGVINAPLFGGSASASGATLSLAFGQINPDDGLPDFAGAPFFTHTFTTEVLNPNTPSLQTVDLSSFNVVIPDNSLLMVSIFYDGFDFNHLKATAGAATVGSSTDALRPYGAGDISRSGDLMYELRVVPGPGATVLVGLGGLFAVRRRR